jgi:hypothetical protein
MFLDLDFPAILSGELYRPRSNYFTKNVINPMFVHDFDKQPGETIVMDRYHYWGGDETLTLESRQRTDTQTIGTIDSREILKDKIRMTVREYTGPSAAGNPNQPSTLKIPMRVLKHAQRKLWEYGNSRVFHDSIGSNTLFDDFMRWEDRVYIQQLLKSPHTYNPGAEPDGGTYATGPVQISVRRDLLNIVEGLRDRLVPTFPDGTYGCLASPRFIKHLRQDQDFRDVARYPGFVSTDTLSYMGPGPQQIPYVSNPNNLIFRGSQVGQPAMGAGGSLEVMPTGFVFEGIRFFESTNLPKARVPLNYTALNAEADAADAVGLADRTAHLGIFFGPGAVGVGVAGTGPQVLLNTNNDFDRFIIAIWQMFGAWELLNPQFITVARTYGYGQRD